MVMSPPVDFVKRTLNQPIVSNSEEIQQQLNSQEEALPADTLGNDLPAQEVEEEKPKRKSRKKVEEKPVEADPDLENFKESTKRLSLQTVFNKMAQSEQKTIIVKEIKFEESFDFTGSMAQLQKTFQVELERKKTELDALYRAEIQKIKDKVALKNIAQMMAETVVGMRKQGWSFNIWCGNEVVSKYFTPFLPLTDCYAQEGWIKFNDPFCLLKAIHVDYTQKKLSNIFVETQGIHPNVHPSGSRGACTGTLANRDIDILNSRTFLVLLDEIERTYKFGNLTSAYNSIPTNDKSKYTILKNQNDIEKNRWY